MYRQTKFYCKANVSNQVCSWNFRWDRLFWPFDSETDDYSAYLHLAQMISLLGPPPRDLLAKSPFSTLLFNNARMYILNQPSYAVKSLSGYSLPCVLDKDEKDRDDFVDFVRRMLAWQPEQRDTAAELLQHPWLEELRHIGVYRKIYCSLPTYEGV
ncbi:Serine/threonine-protein kinase 3 [Diplodia seriata]|uniref:Serine/threonine-protein kinase 3 n=1 Tax=Diplodia seriata TaxID=420778 RepID=A0A1S8BJV8_9PEZI|nr:Serine/threonine-protein kinase 3 [Diplodia seriata]